MPLVLLPTLALAAGAALALAAGGAASAARRAEARRIVLCFAWLVLMPVTLFPALVSPSWSLAGLLEAEGGASAVLVVLSAAGAALSLPAFELCSSWHAGRSAAARATSLASGASIATGLVLYLARGRLAEVPMASSAHSLSPPASFGDSALPPLLGVLLALGALGFALCVGSLRALARPSGQVEPERAGQPR